jgi:hypothetical protein
MEAPAAYIPRQNPLLTAEYGSASAQDGINLATSHVMLKLVGPQVQHSYG